MSFSDIVALASLVVAIAAVVVAIRSNRRSHHVESQLAEIEEARRRDELRPVLDAVYHRQQGRPFVTIVNDGPMDYDEVVVELGDHPPGVHSLMRGDGVPVGSVTLEDLRLGASNTVYVFEPSSGPPRGGPMRLNATCVAGSESWSVVLAVEVPRGGVEVW